jgi:uncharacterized membrane protein YfcA
MTLSDATTLAAVAVLATMSANLLHRRRGEPLYPDGGRGGVLALVGATAIGVLAALYLLDVFAPGWFALGVAIVVCAANVRALAHRVGARRAVGQRPV